MKPILFNTEMVRAILDGRKTVTRRVVKPQPKGRLIPTRPGRCWLGYFAEEGTPRVVRPPYFPGDILYVRETWAEGYDGGYIYKADDKLADLPSFQESTKMIYRPSIHMPREAARIFLRVTDVRVERLQDMTEDDIAKDFDFNQYALKVMSEQQKDVACMALWDSTIKKSDRALYGWDANPWVWVIEFERISREEVTDGLDTP